MLDNNGCQEILMRNTVQGIYTFCSSTFTRFAKIKRKNLIYSFFGLLVTRVVLPFCFGHLGKRSIKTIICVY